MNKQYKHRGQTLIMSAFILISLLMQTVSIKADEYRNVALRRLALASSSIDFNLTAQLATDGIIEKGEPATLKVTVGNAGKGTVLSLRDKEKTIDGNIHSQNTLSGEEAFIQYDWTGFGVSPNSLTLNAEVAYNPDLANHGYNIKLLSSKDGKSWNEIGIEKGDGLPGEDTKQMVSSDPNKQEATIKLPLRLVNTTIPLKDNGEVRHLRIVFNMKGCAYWRLYEINNGHNANWMPSYHFTSAWVADSKVDANPWICVDLGAEADISEVELAWIHKPRKGEIQVSDDKQNWRTVKSLTSSDSYSCNTRGRYVRLTMGQPDKSGFFALSELQVIGKGGILPTVKESKDGITAWQLRRDSETDWIPATVPGTVLTSYIRNGAVPDNTFDNNMRQISESYFNSDFWYRAKVKVGNIEKGKHTYLCFDGINWKAIVWLNGTELGQINGAFLRAKYDVTKLLHEGDNDLEIKVIKNAHFGAVKEKNLESTDLNGGILGADNPTFHASIGWDWITSVPGREVGIWNDVYLTTDNGVSVTDPYVTTTLSDNNEKATMTPTVIVKNNDSAQRTVNVKGWIGDITFNKEVTLVGNEEKEVSFSPADFPQLKDQNMKLWWPNGYGEPYLYDAGVTIDGDESSTLHYKAGIREMKYETLDTKTKIFVNGKRLIPLGGNWGFSEINLNYTAKDYDAAVRYHKEQNFNMIRNWVGQIGDEELYDACDKYGIVVWQDFWLANPWDGPDPDDNEMFLANSQDLIKKIRRHPSIGIYVGRNEGFPPPVLDKGLRLQIKALHPQLGYIPSSADDGVSGHGPYQMMPTKYYFENQSQKLHSERGMPNVPTYEGLCKMLSPDKLWPINEAWGQHDFTLKGAQHGDFYCDIMEKHFGKPTSAMQFTEWAQWLNYDGYRAMYESSQQYRMGLLIWMSHSCWPSLVWCTYDYYFEPTAAYFGAKKACEPLHVQFNEATRKVEVVNIAAGVHDNLVVVAQTLDMYGRVMETQNGKVSVNDDQTVESVKIEAPQTDVYYVRLYLKENGRTVSENFYVEGREADKLTALNSLPKVALNKKESFAKKGDVHVGEITVANPTATPALLIRLNLVGSDGKQILPVIYSDNYFSLMPGEEKSISVSYNDEDGRGATPSVSLSAFN